VVEEIYIYIYGLFIEKTARLRRQKTLKAKTEPH
jgi:hypothetical protein